jgi:SAM-dependent methyltransferase
MGAPDWARPFLKQFRGPTGALGALATVTMAVENDGTNHRLVDLADLRPGDRALDVGCGPGTAVRHAVRVPGLTATGIDASSTAIRVARALSHRALRTGRLFLEVADVTALPYEDGAFTVAWTMNSLHHWSGPSTGLGELHRVLEPGGRLLVGERRPSPDAGKWSPPGLSDESVRGVVARLEAAGFEVAPPQEQAVKKDRFVVIRGSRLS